MARRREFNVFSLAFLDIMSCGFGAVILVYIIINHATEATSQELNTELAAEVKRLQELVDNETENLVQLKTVVHDTEEQIMTTDEMTRQIIDQIEELTARIQNEQQQGANQKESIEDLKSELKRLEEEAANLRGSVDDTDTRGTSLRTFVGDGNRQYLTGLNVGGQHIAIVVDTSASMLHKTIVNAIRLNNMPVEQKIRAEKWQRAIRTVDWISANLPRDAQFALMTFSDQAEFLTGDETSNWAATSDSDALETALKKLREVVPGGGTSLHLPFEKLRRMEPRPDNIFLIVDGLPTQGMTPPERSVISSKDRVRLYTSAIQELPPAVPVNIILFPMEGDPLATPSYWILAQQTAGSFMSPSKDWP
ncbi:MAG: VWA domain-containing protein [Pseudomonadales bacterium]|nr:VWA domain-containing protein [Pseudomonadales bacterium]